MQQQTVRVSSATFSPWIPFDNRRSWFGAGLAVVISDDATLTYSVQHTYDDLYTKNTAWTATRSGTTVTVEYVNHGVVAGSSVLVEGAGAPFDGEFSVASVVDADSFTYTVANSGATTAVPGSRMGLARVFEHTTLTSQSASKDGNYAYPPAFCRLLVSAYTDGFAELTVIQQGA